MEIAKSDGVGVDALGIKRRVFAGQPIPVGVEVDKKIIASGEELGHLNPVAQGDHESAEADARNEAVVTAQQHRSDVEGNLKQVDDRPERKPNVGPESEAPDVELVGEALATRASELGIRGRAKMTAGELRAAIAKAEAKGDGEEDEK